MVKVRLCKISSISRITENVVTLFFGLEKFQRIKAENFRISEHIGTPLLKHIGTPIQVHIDTPPVIFVNQYNQRIPALPPIINAD